MGNTSRTYYQDLGDRFEEYMSDYDVEQRISLIFDYLLETGAIKGRQVLEVGSGTGRISQVVSAAQADLTIVDIGRQLVKNVAQELACDGTAADALQLPFASNTFDLVISSECIEHTLVPEQSIIEMCRVCRPGGIVCLTTPNRLWFPALKASQILGVRKFQGPENWLFPGQVAGVMQIQGMVDIIRGGCHLWPFQIQIARPLLKRFDAAGGWLYPLMINFGIAARKSYG